MEHTAATSLLSLEFQAICTSFVLEFTIFRNNKGVRFTYLFFWELSRPSGARMRTNTEVRLVLPSAKPSLPRELLRGEPPNVPKNHQRFFEKFPSLSFSYIWKKTDARHKQLRYGAGRVVGPPTPPGYGTPLTTPRLSCLRTRNSSQKFAKVAYENTEIE